MALIWAWNSNCFHLYSTFASNKVIEGGATFFEDLLRWFETKSLDVLDLLSGILELVFLSPCSFIMSSKINIVKKMNKHADNKKVFCDIQINLRPHSFSAF